MRKLVGVSECFPTCPSSSETLYGIDVEPPLTIASVAVSLCLLAVLMALYRALFCGGDTTPGQAMRLVVHHKISLTEDLPVAYEEKIEQIPGVQTMTSLRWFGGTYKDARDTRNHFAQFAIEPQKLFEVYPEFRISDNDKQAFISGKTACVASKLLAELSGRLLSRKPLPAVAA